MSLHMTGGISWSYGRLVSSDICSQTSTRVLPVLLLQVFVGETRFLHCPLIVLSNNLPDFENLRKDKIGELAPFCCTVLGNVISIAAYVLLCVRVDNVL